MDQLWEELRKHPVPMMMYPAPIEDRIKLTFTGNKWENSLKFLVNCEKEMERTGSATSDNNKITFVTRFCKE